MNRDELNEILKNHRKWLDDPDKWGYEGMANLHDANLREVDLHDANLRYANLLGANLWHADLESADLQCADMQYANLQGADLQFADLAGADLKDANLKGANLRGAVLQDADLRGANLLRADLLCADLRRANLNEADVRGANLRGVDLEHAYTYKMEVDKKTKTDWPTSCPETGSFIGWKKAGDCIVKLEIPEDAKRSSATTSKCRASKVKVLEIQNMDGTTADVTEVITERCWIYKVGGMVYPDSWDDNRWNECSHGIHFFMTRDEAVAW